MIGFNHLGQFGRLGNQMFQYASLRGIAERIGVDCCIPNHQQVARDGHGNILRIELFDAFKLTHLKHRQLLVDDVATKLAERQFHYDEELHNRCPDNVSLSGFFQSEKWFKHIENGIREDFQFKEGIHEMAANLISPINDPIALHARRTDYVGNAKNHPPLSIDYYQEALRFFPDDRTVLVFSDEVAWCRQQELFQGERFIFSESGNSCVDLCAMSLCDDFIIANSSYSWWGAWLSGNPGKRVVAPTLWFGTEGYTRAHNTADLIPDGWIRI